MSRYLERAENVAQFVDANELLMLDLPAGMPRQWWPLVEVTGDAEAFQKRYPSITEDDVFQFLAFDPENPNSILSALRAARENARSIRETISSAMWQEINEAYLFVESQAADLTASKHDFLRQVVRASYAIEGATSTTLSRAKAWHFGRTGRLLERADQTTRIVDIRYFMLLPAPEEGGSPADDLHWTSVLHSVSAFEMYRQRHGVVHRTRAADFLLLDPEFPRSVRTCLRQADESLHALTGTAPGRFRNGAERRLGRLAAELAYTSIDEVLGRGLHDFCDSVQSELIAVGAAMQDLFFAPQWGNSRGGGARAEG